MYRQVGAFLTDSEHFLDIAKIQFRVHPLGIEVHGQGHQIHVAGPLTIA